MSPSGQRARSGARSPSPDHQNMTLPGTYSEERARIRQASKEVQETPAPLPKQSIASKGQAPRVIQGRTMPWETKIEIGPRSGKISDPIAGYIPEQGSQMFMDHAITTTYTTTYNEPGMSRLHSGVMRNGEYEVGNELPQHGDMIGFSHESTLHSQVPQQYRECMDAPSSVFYYGGAPQSEEIAFSSQMVSMPNDEVEMRSDVSGNEHPGEAEMNSNTVHLDMHASLDDHHVHGPFENVEQATYQWGERGRPTTSTTLQDAAGTKSTKITYTSGKNMR